MKPAYVGIDLAFAKRKRLPIAVCTWRDGRLVPEPLRLLSYDPPRGYGNAAVLNRDVVSDFVEAAADYIGDVCDQLDLSPQRVAIDAPRAPRRPDLRRRAWSVRPITRRADQLENACQNS